MDIEKLKELKRKIRAIQIELDDIIREEERLKSFQERLNRQMEKKNFSVSPIQDEL